MKKRMILLFSDFWAVAENVTDSLLMRIRRCPLACSLCLTTVVFYGIAFFFALEQSIIMLSNLAKLEIMILIGLPTLLAVVTIVVGSSCSLTRNTRDYRRGQHPPGKAGVSVNPGQGTSLYKGA